MKFYFLNLYTSFRCLAGNCQDTCCSGWAILVSKEDYARFQNMDLIWLREDILDNIILKKGKYYFKNRENGDCAMLEPDGLCRIERYTSEKDLCNTCRKFPRIYHDFGELSAFSMSASCPVVADAICNNALSLFQEMPSGEKIPVSFSDIPFCGQVFAFHGKMQDRRKKQGKDRNSYQHFSDLFELFAEWILDILLRTATPLKHAILNLLSYYETESTEENAVRTIEHFCQNQKKEFCPIRDAYFSYRVYSRWIEEPEESVLENYFEVCGELLLLFFFAFLEERRGHDLKKEGWKNMICFSYRFLVHEKEVQKKIHEKFVEFFGQDSLSYDILFHIE